MFLTFFGLTNVISIRQYVYCDTAAQRRDCDDTKKCNKNEHKVNRDYNTQLPVM